MTQVPVFINCRDRLTPMLALVDYLERAGCERVYLVDNASTYPPLLQYYEETPHTVIRLQENHGHKWFWQSGLLDQLEVRGRYVFSDPDTVPIEECPLDAIDYFGEVLDRYSGYKKVGFGLKIDDLPDHYRLKREVIARQSSLWHRLIAPRLYEAPIDTTFALYRTAEHAPQEAIRTGYPYLVRHTTWYLDSENVPDEHRYYIEHEGGVSRWGREELGGGAAGPTPERARGMREKVERLAAERGVPAAVQARPATSAVEGGTAGFGLGGRACVVTGASRGIGLDTARALCAEGASVLLVARTAATLEAAVETCRAAGGQAAALACDVTDPDAGERMLAEARATIGEPDVLVNNAGTSQWRDLDDVPDDDWQAAWELNVMAPLRAMRALVPGMRERGWGRVVNVASTAGKRPSASMPEYSVAKAAELSLSRLWADRCAADGVLVNAVCPGPTMSDLWIGEGGLADQSAAFSGLQSAEQAIAKSGAGRPIGRLAEPHEIAAVIVFLCSQHASYVAGAAWSVDGGTVQVII